AEVVAPALGPQAPALAVEAALLARAYSGAFESARGLLRSLEADQPRLAYLTGLIDQLDGRPATAVVSYRRALALSADGGDVHTLAAVALNLGALQADGGAYGEAIGATERAIRELGRLGATSELGSALFNAANLFGQIGEAGAARRALARAREEG